MSEEKKIISYNDFLKLDIRIGKVIEAESIPKSRNLIKMLIDIGEEEPRQILGGFAQYFEPEEMKDRKVVVLVNLKPRKMMGLESQGMVLAADVDDKPFLLQLEKELEDQVPAGSVIR